MVLPTGVPIKEAILNNIQSIDAAGAAAAPPTGLGLLDGPTTDYYNTPAVITRIDSSPLDLDLFPAVVIAPLAADYDPLSARGTLTISATYRIQLTLILRTRGNAVSEIEQFIRDCHKALLVDKSRGGNAIMTRAVSDEVFYPTDDDEPYTLSNLIVEVDYRTSWNDLNNPNP